MTLYQIVGLVGKRKYAASAAWDEYDVAQTGLNSPGFILSTPGSELCALFRLPFALNLRFRVPEG